MEILRLPLLGPVLAMLLHQRGLLSLHASAIAVDGSAVVFLGEKGQGKSTIAAGLYARGHTLIADDLVAIDVGKYGEATVLPGFPQLKLMPDAAATALREHPQPTFSIAPGAEKRRLRIEDRFSEAALPLKALFVLFSGPLLGIHPLRSQCSALQLIRHSFAARFGKSILSGQTACDHLKLCASLLQHTPICQLERPQSLALLPETASFVETLLRAEPLGDRRNEGVSASSMMSGLRRQ
jgi:hypothetical protein